MKIILYGADCTGDASNCLYPHKMEITSPAELAAAVAKDQIGAKFKGDYRNTGSFEEAFVLQMDCDNEHSENPADWITPEMLADDPDLVNVQFAVTPSRHNMLPKGSFSARPRFHFHAVIERCTDPKKLAAMKKALHQKYGFFDKNALDATRLMFGAAVSEDEVLWHDGWLTIDEVLAQEFDEDRQGNVIPEGCRNNTLSRFAARVLKRFGDSDKAYEIYLEEAKKCDPPLEDDELSTIWRSALNLLKEIESDPNYIPPEQYESGLDASAEPNWDDPLPFGDESLPEFPINALPEVLRNYAVAVGRSTQTPVDMAAVGCLTAVSACMRNLYKVEGKPDWHEPTNIYTVTIAEPSERKSAVTALTTKPIDEFIKEYNDRHKVEFEMSKATKQRLENRKNSLISQSKKKGEEPAASDFNDELRSVVEQLVNFEEAKPMKVYVDDTTPEKLTETLAENGGSISIISSEGGIFDVLSGTYSSKVNIDVFLKAYSGEKISVERIMRQSISVDEACLTILLSVQPVVIGELMSNKKFRHRGLTARFLYAIPKSFVGTRSLDSEPIKESDYLAYKALIYNILSENKKGRAEIIRLTPEAKEVLSSYYNWVEKRLTGEYSMYADWLGKLVGNTLRIAGILARSSVMRKDVGDAFLETDTSIIIDRELIENAISIGKYFIIHAVTAYGDMGVKTDFKSALAVMEKMREKNLTKISRRDVMRSCRWIGTAEEAQNVINNLEDYGYVRLVSIDASDKLRNGRPKNALYAVNPKVL